MTAKAPSLEITLVSLVMPVMTGVKTASLETRIHRIRKQCSAVELGDNY